MVGEAWWEKLGSAEPRHARSELLVVAHPLCYCQRVLLDCQACGACCCNTQKNVTRGHRSYIEVLPSDVLFQERSDLLGSLTVLDETRTHQMRLVNQEQRCVALCGTLGENVRCEIYAWRPLGCRQVEPGDEECLKARRLHPPRVIRDA